ncbi:MAG: succinylglutamate desuccinylase/aspartoacylase family protein [Elusimicrobia bacterium]|nr:succinylglutamate desuccinylase/aspartoacylase family protein [Elusimicrobiota bacterium]
MRRLPTLLLAGLALAACRHGLPYRADGRAELADLHARYRELAGRHGWIEETVFAYPQGERILAWRTKQEGEALWLIAGIHGEEPAGPNAVARSVDRLAELAAAGVPVVLLPLCNPRGYAANWRYPNTSQRDWRKGGYSVGDAEHLLPDPKDPARARTPRPPGPETAALTTFALGLAQRYPPRLALDLHEDELSTEGGYLYSQGARGKDDPAAREVIAALRGSEIPLRLSGKTRFGEPIVDGVVGLDEQGAPIQDGSIDELLAAREVIAGGVRAAGPGSPSVIVVETPAFAGSRLESRVDAHRRVLDRLGELWRLSRN